LGEKQVRQELAGLAARLRPVAAKRRTSVTFFRLRRRFYSAWGRLPPTFGAYKGLERVPGLLQALLLTRDWHFCIGLIEIGTKIAS
jgi:hypothetical protein